MKKIILAESFVPLIIALVLIQYLPMSFSWWVWILFFLAPDISMAAYLFGNKIGALGYNLAHHQLVAVFIGCMGLWLQIPYLQLAGLVMLGHSSMDRVFGYGLKSMKGFHYTHLGEIGRKPTVS